VFAPPTRRNDGTLNWPPDAVSATCAPPFTDTVELQPLPDGAASDTAHDAPATAPVNDGDADSPFPNAAVAKLDGHEPLTTSFVEACGEPDGAFTTELTVRDAGSV
jgi:hypothetical protein